MDTEFLTVMEYAYKWRKHPNTIQRALRENKLPGAIKQGGSWRIPVDAMIGGEPAHTEAAVATLEVKPEQAEDRIPERGAINIEGVGMVMADDEIRELLLKKAKAMLNKQVTEIEQDDLVRKLNEREEAVSARESAIETARAEIEEAQAELEADREKLQLADAIVEEAEEKAADLIEKADLKLKNAGKAEAEAATIRGKMKKMALNESFHVDALQEIRLKLKQFKDDRLVEVRNLAQSALTKTGYNYPLSNGKLGTQAEPDAEKA